MSNLIAAVSFTGLLSHLCCPVPFLFVGMGLRNHPLPLSIFMLTLLYVSTIYLSLTCSIQRIKITMFIIVCFTEQLSALSLYYTI